MAIVLKWITIAGLVIFGLLLLLVLAAHISWKNHCRNINKKATWRNYHYK